MRLGTPSSWLASISETANQYYEDINTLNDVTPEEIEAIFGSGKVDKMPDDLSKALKYAGIVDGGRLSLCTGILQSGFDHINNESGNWSWNVRKTVTMLSLSVAVNLDINPCPNGKSNMTSMGILFVQTVINLHNTNKKNEEEMILLRS